MFAKMKFGIVYFSFSLPHTFKTLTCRTEQQMLLDADVKKFLTLVKEHRLTVFEVLKEVGGPKREETTGK
jgi:hypothetical protein